MIKSLHYSLVIVVALFGLGQNFGHAQKTIDVDIFDSGEVKAIPVHIEGFTGDILSLLKFDLFVQGFEFVDKVKGNKCKICCTRKTAPNLRLIQKYGVKVGGGFNHRFNLSDEILIKDNHISIEGNIRKLVMRAIKNRKGKKITVEVDNLNQLKKIIGLKFNRVLFDNMSTKNLKKGVKISNRLYETEASGGITLKNVKKIASTGVKRISVGKITHSAPSVDFKLEI